MPLFITTVLLVAALSAEGSRGAQSREGVWISGDTVPMLRAFCKQAELDDWGRQPSPLNTALRIAPGITL